MKYILKVILPPFIAFVIFSAGINYSPAYFTDKVNEMGMGILKNFLTFYRFTLPLLFAVAALTQLLIVIPWRRAVLRKEIVHGINAFIDLCFICLVFALSIGYAIWDPQHGTHNLVMLVGFMWIVQLIYWLINLLVLYLIE